MKRGLYSPIPTWSDPRAGVRGGKPQRTIPLGPFRGVRDVGDFGEQDSQFLQDAINCWFADPMHGGSVYARPGFEQTTASQLGTVSGRMVQGIATSPFVVWAVCGGKLYRRTSSLTWTDVTPAGPTINSTTPVHMLFYNGELIVSDGTNKPWRGTDLTATPITGTNIEIDSTPSAWSARGRPTVYGGKLFFIVNSKAGTSHRTRLIWSEEADASSGYEQSGFSNFWELIQTSSDTITAIQGTNAALYYWRVNSIGAISGAVNATFATTSTHDAVSPRIGTNAPGAVLLADDYIWFVSYEGLLYRFAVGSQDVEPIWLQLKNRVEYHRRLNTSLAGTASQASSAYLPDLGKVVFGGLWAESSGLAPSRNIYVFDAKTSSYEGRWMVGLSSQPTSDTPNAVRLGFGVGCLAAAFDVDGIGNDGTIGKQVLLVGGTDQSGNEGHVWRQWFLTSGVVGDDTAAMHQSITTMLVPKEENVQVHVDLVALSTVPGPDTAPVTLDYYSPYGSRTGITMGGTASSDSIASTYDHGIQRAGLGSMASGRWWRGVFHKNIAAGTATHAFEGGSLTVRITPTGPNSP